MNRYLIPSDTIVIRSDDPPGPFRICPAQTPSSAGRRFAVNRAHPTRHVGRDLQALWAAELPLRQRTGTWSEVLSIHQPTRRPPPKRLHTKCRASEGRQIDRQLAQVAQYARRNLRDQCRTTAAARGTHVGPHASGTRNFRYRQIGRHSRRHGHLLSRRRRLAIRFKGEAR